MTTINVVFANHKPSAEFFASNNTKEINIQTAYDRLTGSAQSTLQNSMIEVLQKNHIEQGRFEDILGAYRMLSDKNITADNTEHFNTSVYQNLSDTRVLWLAKELAIALNQDSVVVFIPDQSTLGDITVSFAHPVGINEVVRMIHAKLPDRYNQAYSLHLINKYAGFNNVKVESVEWLGSKVNLEEVEKAFPLDKINYQDGKVYLVYQNGQTEQL